MSDIGKKVYARRKELGLTLEDVGNAVGVGKSTVRRWENGMIKNMGADKIPALAKVLQMKSIEFVPGVDDQEATGLKKIEVRQPQRKSFAAEVILPKQNPRIKADLGLPEIKGVKVDKDLESFLKVWNVSKPKTRKKIVKIAKEIAKD
jgi:transcriptional regulator with XRE-family HTH domain